MDKKIIKALEDQETTWLETIEEEIVDEAVQKRILRQALNKITPPKRRKFKKPMLLVAILVSLTGISVGAMSTSEWVQKLFGKNMEIVQENVQVINKSMTQGGITMTLDTAITDASGGLIVVHFTKENEEIFESNEILKDIEITINGNTPRAYKHGWDVSEDGKMLTYIVNIIEQEGGINGEVSIQANDLVKVIPNDKILCSNIGEIANNKEMKPIYLQELSGDVMIQKVGYYDEKLIIYTQAEEGQEMFSEQVILWNDADQAMKSSNGMMMHASEGIENQEIYYKPITEEELQEIQVIQLANKYEYVQEGEWEVNAQLQPNKYTKSFHGEKAMPHEHGQVVFEEVELSVLGGVIKGAFHMTAPPELNIRYDNPEEITVGTKSGEIIMMHVTTSRSQSSGAGEIQKFTINIEVGEGSRREDYTEEEIEQIYLEGVATGLNRKKSIEGLVQEELIHIDQVEWIEVDGTRIPLK